MAARLAEQLPDPGGADAGVHLDEVRSTDRDEGDSRLSGHRARQQRLAGARRADEQDAARNPPADRGEPRRLLEEIDDLAHLVLGFVDAGDVLERDRHVLRVDRPHFLERRYAPAHAKQHQTGDPEHDQTEDERLNGAGARALDAFGAELHAAIDQAGKECRVQRDEAGRRCRLDIVPSRRSNADRVGIDGNRPDTIGLHVTQKIGKRYRSGFSGGARDDRQQRDDENRSDRAGDQPDRTYAWQLAFETLSNPLTATNRACPNTHTG